MSIALLKKNLSDKKLGNRFEHARKEVRSQFYKADKSVSKKVKKSSNSAWDYGLYGGMK